MLGGRAAAAAFYPLPLITEILRGIRDTHEAEHPEDAGPEAEMQRGMARAALLHDEPPSLVATLHENDRQHKSTPRRTTFRLADGKNKSIDLNPNFRDVYRDEYTGEALPKSWVEEAIHDDIDYFNTKV